jgi:ABC-type protease/lipase transport system fused ATPase/permease subunit
MKLNKHKLRTLLVGAGYTLLFTVPLLLFYMFAITQRWGFVFWLYFLALGAVGVAYFLYNRAFFHTRVSRNELSASFSDAQKDEFFEEGERRAKRSRPLLYLLIALALVFLYDMIYLFLWESIVGIFPFLGELV